MNDSEIKLVKEMRTVAASHRLNGEPRTCEYLERAADHIEFLCSKIDRLQQSPQIGDKS